MLSIAEIDFRILQLNENIRALKTLRNAQTMLGRLPAELLLIVLQNIPWMDLLSMHSVCKQINALMNILHGLWSLVPIVRNWRISELFIRRAGPSLLTFNPPLYACDQLLYQSVMDNLHNTRICKTAVTQNSQAFLKFLHEHEAKSLESLLLTKMTCFGPVDAYAVTSDLFAGACPSLSTLQLCGVQLVGLPFAPRLTKMSLSRTHTSTEQLCHVLHSTPCLQYLYLAYITEGVGHSDCSPVGLPDLESIIISEKPEYMAHVLAILPDPSTHFEVDIGTDSFLDAPILWSSVDGPNLNILRRLSTFWQVVSGESDLPKAVASASFTAYTEALNGDHCLSFGSRAPRDASFKSPSVFYRISPCAIMFDDPFLPRITELKVSLGTCYKADDTLINGNFTLHLLTSIIHLIMADTAIPDAGDALWLTISPLQEVVAWLETRKRNGVPAIVITLERCHGMRPWVNLLIEKELVSEVRWACRSP
jgi:hypothetical protein